MSIYASLAMSISIVGICYGLGLRSVIKKRGLDPSLITYLTPLNIKNYWAARILIIFTLMANLIYPAMSLAPMILVLLAGAHIALLLLFRRGATQPVVYYGGIAVIGLLTLFEIKVLPAVLIVFIVQEIYLFWWQKSQQARYQKWVAREAIKIHRQHQSLASTMSKREWFHVLHFATTENIARPPIVRLMERLFFYWKRPAYISTGIMQVRSDRILSDNESMAQGSRIIADALRKLPARLTKPSEQLKWLAKTYNGSTTYGKYLLHTYPGVNDAWKSISKQL